MSLLHIWKSLIAFITYLNEILNSIRNNLPFIHLKHFVRCKDACLLCSHPNEAALNLMSLCKVSFEEVGGVEFPSFFCWPMRSSLRRNPPGGPGVGHCTQRALHQCHMRWPIGNKQTIVLQWCSVHLLRSFAKCAQEEQQGQIGTVLRM